MSRRKAEAESDEAPESEPLCQFGRPVIDPEWSGEDHCAGCHAETLRLLAKFEADVQAGQHDRFGFTRADLRDAHARFPLLVKMDS